MKVLIIEDEELSAERLEILLRKCDPAVQVLAKLDSVRTAVEWFSAHAMPDLAFFDIQLADGLSFEIFQKIEITCPIVFTTAFNQYAIEAFKVNSIDYLLKPFGVEDLQRAFEKLKILRGGVEAPATPDLAAIQNMMRMLSGGATPQRKTRFMVKVGEHLNSVATDDVAFFWGENKIVWLYTKAGKRYVVDYTLDALEDLLEPSQFFRLNRQCIAGIDSIKDVVSYSNSRLKIVLHNPPTKDDIVMSREKVDAFKNWLGK